MQKIKGFVDTINWYEENAVDYATKSDSMSSPALLNKFTELVGEDGKILDAGCAAGRDSKLLTDRGLRVIGIDLVNKFVELAKKRFPDIEFHQGSFLKVPFVGNSFDGVWAHASLLHFEEISEVRKALSEFRRVLKSGGILHIMVKKQLDDEKTEVVTDSVSNHDRFFRWFTAIEVQELLASEGFDLISIDDTHADPAGRDEVEWIIAFAKKK